MATYLLPGAGSTSWYWHRVVPLLQAHGHGVVAPIVCTRVPVTLLVLVAAMTPRPGESAGDWWANTGHAEAQRTDAISDGRDPDVADPFTIFLHDVPAYIAAASAAHLCAQSGTPFAKPWPLDAWPDVPTRFLACRHDRFFPLAFQQRVVRDRLGFVPDEMDGGHLRRSRVQRTWSHGSRRTTTPHHTVRQNFDEVRREQRAPILLMRFGAEDGPPSSFDEVRRAHRAPILL